MTGCCIKEAQPCAWGAGGKPAGEAQLSIPRTIIFINLCYLYLL